ncbi:MULTISPECIES: hypothetical protein [unclassified Egicoccus]|uniref:hypothetical protein n=1 Tax=unclassified Egicoccus TaxID=2635606 RepID=UPI00359E44CA
MTARTKKRRPYRVELIGKGTLRRHSYATLRAAVKAALADAQHDTDLYLTQHRQYVVEHHTFEGPWLPIEIVVVDGAGNEIERRHWRHETAAVTS